MEKNLIKSLNYLRNQMKEDRPTDKLQNMATVDSDHRRRELLKKIEDVVLNTVRNAVNPVGEPSLQLRPRRRQWKDCHLNQRLMLKARTELPLQQIKYSTHKKRFEMIFNLLSKIYRLLQTKGSMTQRELFYEQTELFGSQVSVNSALMDICSLLTATPWELRVFSTSKGLVAGDLKITTADKRLIDCSKPGGVMVPQDVKNISKIESTAAFILLIEKDAAFQKLLDDGAHLRFAPCILITGKGEPDINTRLLVHRLYRDLTIPVLVIVDADPYGIEIMCTYRFGSLSLSQHAEHLAVPGLRWLGIHPTDIDKLSIPTVPFTVKDFAKARDLVSRPYILQNEQLLDQVNCLLESGNKCEIENLTALSPTFLTDMFLSYKITSREVI